MADSKSAGRRAVRVRVPLRVQGRSGALAGSAARPRAGFLVWFFSRGWRAATRLPLVAFGGGRASGVLSVVNAPSGGCCQIPHSASALVGRAARVVSCVWLVPSFVGAAPGRVWLV